MTFPSSIFDAPVLRDLGESARDAVASAGRVVDVADGDVIYREADPGDSFYVVVAGDVSLRAVRRGDEDESEVRVARRGDTFGEEATLPGWRRRMTAVAASDSRVAEIPIAVFRRAVGRSGGELADRERRVLERAATRDLLGTLAFTRELDAVDQDVVLDSARHRSVPRGDRVYSEGDPPASLYFVVDGLVQLQVADADRISVRAYVARGDFFGDEDIVARRPRALSAVALGDCELLELDAVVVRSLFDRHPRLAARLRRVAERREARQLRVVGPAAARTTRHVFQDLYRMQMARAMLVIDQETCVRCGHCAWSCAEVHGTSRLVRRGDKVLTNLTNSPGAPRSLSLPNTCQHCKNPSCMIDCPTGAIGRDPQGEVFVREELCTGCGNCAKACPWENIRMAPRADAPGDVAVKCDLCRDYEAPACVQACPTESIFRLEPTRDVAEVAGLLGERGQRVARSSERRRALAWAVPSAAALAIALVGVGRALHHDGAWRPGAGLANLAGWGAAVAVAALMAYAVPKRLVRRWMVRRERERVAHSSEEPARTPVPRSRVRAHYVAHVAIGLVGMGIVALHTGLSFPRSLAGGLHVAFWLTALLGAGGALAQRLVPARLARIEREADLPEDLARARADLFDRLHRDATGRSDLVKALVGKVLVPYARSTTGPLELLISGRSLSDEQRCLRARIDALLEGRGGERLAGLDELVRTVVELRALPARRLLGALLRGWHLPHVVLTGVVVAGLALHVLSVVRWP